MRRRHSPSPRCYTKPDFQDGDWVVPIAYVYPGWKDREPRLVERVQEEASTSIGGGSYWVLKIFNPAKDIKIQGGYSLFNPNNFKKVDTMSTQKTQFFAVKLLTTEPEGFKGEYQFNDTMTTPHRDSQSEVREDIKERIVEGDKWLVCQVVAMFEGEPPRPPIRITEFR